MSQFHETLILFRVLSDSPIPQPGGPIGLAELAAGCVDGDNVGEIVMTSSRQVTRVHMGELLYSAGGESGFFGIQDLPACVEDLRNSADQTGCTEGLAVVDGAAIAELCELAEIEHTLELPDNE